MFARTFLCTALALVAGWLRATPGLAQAENRISDEATHAWYQYIGDHRLSQHWGVHTEAQLRRASLLTDKQQQLVRVGINYHPSDQVMFTLGYAYADTYPYGDYPAKAAFPEHRLYEQLQLNQPALGRLSLSHRYRLEQRWITFPGLDEAQLLNRARYQLRATVPLTRPKLDPGTLYAYVYDEILLGFGRHVANNIFDQNRAGVGLGYKFTKHLAVEAGYLHQLLEHRDGKVFEYNHTLQLAVVGSLDLRRAIAAPVPAAP